MMSAQAKVVLLSLLLSLQHTAFARFNYSVCESEVLSGAYGLEGLVDQNGNPVSSIAEAEGYQYPLCKANCGTGCDPNDWLTISTQVATWLLPWVALAAQLPIQTTNGWQDIRAVLLVIGSPILALYSLLLSIFNSRWAKDKCARLARNYATRDGVTDHMKVVGEALVACQHAPLQVQANEVFWSICAAENRNWWRDFSQLLHNASRGFPVTLWVQMGLATVAFTFTISDAFLTPEGVASY